MLNLERSQASDLKVQIDNLLAVYESERSNRSHYYDLRKMFYSGLVRPKVGEGHEQITSELASAIADKMAAYIGTSRPRINLKPFDINSDEELMWAEFWEREFSNVLNNSDFDELYLDTNEVASRLGDGFIVTEIKNGMPFHYGIQRPENVMLGWRTDNFKEIEWWCYFYGLSKQAAKVQFSKEFQEMSNQSISNIGIVGNTPEDLYGFNNLFNIGVQDPSKNLKMVQIADFHAIEDVSDDVKSGDNVVIVNKVPYQMNPGKAKKIYHIIANSLPDSPTGICDFEHAAHLITIWEQELSKQSDVNTQGSYPKYITTERNTKQIEAGLKPGKTQVIKVSDEPNAKFDVLKTQNSTYNAEPLIKNILNIIRTTTHLQEIGQDQISPNISGKALTMVYQGVVQTVTKKRIRWNKIFRQMVLDDIDEMTKTDKVMRQTAFDENGNFKFDIEVIWPEVMEQDKASRIATVQSMRQGQTPLVSSYTAMQMIDIPDPIQEEKRIKKEMAENMAYQQALVGTEMQPSNPQGPILTESDNQPTEGVASSPGLAGSAQQSISPEGQTAMQANNGSQGA